jgi:hypothetical protein
VNSALTTCGLILVLSGTRGSLAMMIGKARPRRNAHHLECSSWSRLVSGLGRWGDRGCGVRWPAVVVPLSMVGPLDGEVAHLPLDHPRIGAVAPWRVDLVGDLPEEAPVVVILIGEGGKIPESRSWTG